MTDYTQTLLPPDWRNLPLNPGGEEAIAATWIGSNGTVVTGSTDIDPISGAGVVKYTVTGTTSLSYYFAPLGPTGPVHATAFAIPGTRTVSARFNLTADRPTWARVQASWLTAARDPLGAVTNLNEISKSSVGNAVQLSAPGAPPPQGTLFGVGGNNTLRTSADIDIDRWYGGSGAGEIDQAVTRCNANHAAGIRTALSFKVPVSWGSAAAGGADTWFNEIVTKLDALPYDVDLAIHHEPEGDGVMTDWTAMQARFANMIPGGTNSNIKYWLAATGYDQERGSNQSYWWENIFPTSAADKIFGIALDYPYDKYGYTWTPDVATGTKGTTLTSSHADGEAYVNDFADRAEALGVNCAIWEWGYSDEAYANQPAWAKLVLAAAKERGLFSIIYYDTTVNSSKTWTLGASNSAKRAYLMNAMADLRDDPVAVTNTVGDWVTIELQVPTASIPAGATHWRPLITVYGADPSKTQTPPALSTAIFADETFVTDSGLSLVGVPYLDGDVPGAIWEGEPYYSSSRTEPAPEPEVPDDPPDIPTDPEPDPNDIPDPPDTDPPPPPVDPPPMPETPPAEPPYTGRPYLAIAEDTLTIKSGNQHICLDGDVQLGNLLMNRRDEGGVVWLISDIEGWWTMPDPDVPDVPRGWFDGSYETRGRYAARTITVTGSFIPQHPRDVAAARDRLIRAANLTHTGDWFMTHDDPSPARTDTKGCKVWLAGQPLINTTAMSGRTDFSLVLRAPDPIKYGIKDGLPPGYESLTLVTADQQMPERDYPREYPWAYPSAIFGNTVAQAVNRGNTVVWPVLKMKGPTMGAVRITNADTGQVFRIIRKLYPGETLVIDCFTKQVTLNDQGNFRFYLDVDVDWLMLQPGPNRLYFTEETLGGQTTELDVQWRSGWIG